MILQVVGVVAGGAAALFAWLALRQPDGEPADSSGMGSAGAAAPAGSAGSALSDNEVEALARVVASEVGSGTRAEQEAVAWAVRNRFRGKSIRAVEHPWRAQRGSKPPFSSARPASAGHALVAREVLAADQALDPTGGATAFFEPRMQDAFAKAGALARAGETGRRVIDGVPLSDITRFKYYKKNAAQIRASWSKGDRLTATVGRFEFWGRARATVAGDLELLGAMT